MEKYAINPDIKADLTQYLYRRRKTYISLWLQVLIVLGLFVVRFLMEDAMQYLGIYEAKYSLDHQGVLSLVKYNNQDITNVFFCMLLLILIIKFMLYYAQYIPLLKQWQEQKEQQYFKALKGSYAFEIKQKDIDE